MPEGQVVADLDHPQARLFLYRARRAVHEALYFTTFIWDTWPKSGQLNFEPGAKWRAKQVRNLCEFEVAKELLGPHMPDCVRTFLELRELARALEAEASAANAKAFEKKAKQFFDESRPTRWVPRAEFFFYNSLRYLQLHRGGTIALGVVFGILFFVDAVSDLLLAAGWHMVPAALILFAGAHVPWMAASVIRKRHDRGKATGAPGVLPLWDVAGPSLRRWRSQALPPGRAVTRYRPEHAEPVVLAIGLLWRFLFYGVGPVLAIAYTYFLHEGLRSAMATALILYSIYVVGLLLDIWAFLDRRPIRTLFLIVLLGTLVAFEFEGGLWVITGILVLAGLISALLVGRSTRDAWTAELREGTWNASPYRRMLTTGAQWSFVALLFLGAAVAARSHFTNRGERWTNPSTGDDVPRASWPKLVEPPASGHGEASRPGPIVVMAASGGGSRAAAFTALTLEHLHANHPEVACQLQALSSVSGGSLANAAYIKARMEGVVSCDPAKRGQRPEAGWLYSRVIGDYIWPTIEGSWILGRSRAQVLTESWEETDPERGGTTRLGTTTVGHIAARWAAKSNAPWVEVPMPLFNSSTLDGHAIVISPLRAQEYMDFGAVTRAGNDPYCGLPAVVSNGDKAFAQAMSQREPGDEDYAAPEDLTPTWVYFRDAIYSLELWLPKRDIKLSEAVRASANFPFGFPLVRVVPAIPEVYRPRYEACTDPEIAKGRSRVLLTDGGVLSNSGMWSMYALLMNNLREVRERGVLLIVVDASHMPAYDPPGAFFGLTSAISAQPPIAQSLHRRMLESLSFALGDRFEFVTMSLTPTQGLNVPTTWALPRSRLEDLRYSFSVARGAFDRQLTDAVQRLDTSMGAARGAMDFVRPPLD